MGLQVEISEKKIIFFSSLRSCKHKLEKIEKLILPLEKYLAADYMKKNYSVNCAGLCTKTQSLVLHEIFTFPDRGWTFQDKLWIQLSDQMKSIPEILSDGKKLRQN